MIFPGKIEIGEKIPLSITFTDEADGSPVDPTCIKIKIMTPSDVDTTYTYGTNASLQRESVGVYYINLFPDEAGRWRYHWLSTGVGQAARAGSFNVQHSPFYDRASQDYV